MRKSRYRAVLINRGRINNNSPNSLDSPILVPPHTMDHLSPRPLPISPTAFTTRSNFYPYDTTGHSRSIRRWIHQRKHSLARTRHRRRWRNMGKSDIISDLYIRRRIYRSIANLKWGLEGIYPRDLEGRSRDTRLDGYMVRFLAFDNPYDPHFA